MKFYLDDKCYDIMPNYPNDEKIDYEVLNKVCLLFYRVPVKVKDAFSYEEKLKRILKIHQNEILNVIMLENKYIDILYLYFAYGMEIIEEKNVYKIIEYALEQNDTYIQGMYLSILHLNCYLSDSILFSIREKVDENTRSRVAFLLRKDLPEWFRFNLYNTYSISNLESDIEYIKKKIINIQYENYTFNNDKDTLKYIALLLRLQDLLIEKMNFFLEHLDLEVEELCSGISKVKDRLKNVRYDKYGEIYGIIYS